MYNKQLDTFLAVAKLGSFSKAAESMYLTPSAVIQQINHLEQDLQVSLFTRTRQGVQLTDAGEYLLAEAYAYTRKGRDIRKNLLMIHSRKQTISVGTSLTYKIRLLYDIWVLFSKTRKDYQIRLINIDNDPSGEEADLIEGLFDFNPWQKGWKFLKICDVPVGCAVPKDHPLASRALIRYEDLKSTPIMLMEPACSELHRRIYEDVQSHGGTIVKIDSYYPYIAWDCACRQYMLQAPLCWQDIYTDMRILPCEWGCPIEYGLFYRPDPPQPVQEFLDYTQALYSGENSEPMVPVF